MLLGTGPIRTFRILALALMGALVVIGIAIPPALASKRNRLPKPTGSTPLWPFVVILVLGVAVAVAIAVVGYRTPALSSSAEETASPSRSIAIFQQLMFLRFALAESVAIVSIALAFAITPTSITIYLLGAGISFVLMLVHVWPSQRLVDKVQAVLDRDGGRSDLSAALFGIAQ